MYGEPDSGISLTSINQLKDALTEAGKQSNAPVRSSAFVAYPAVPHAFYADYRPSYRKEAAEDGFQRALDWFKIHGVA